MNAEAYKQTAEDLWAEHAPQSHKMTAGPFGAGGLASIIAWLRANGITFSAIVKEIIPIISIITSGGSWQDIIAALIKLFFPVTPPTVGAPAQP